MQDIRRRKIVAFEQGAYRNSGRNKRAEKLTSRMAVILGIFVTVEIMLAGAMILNYNFHGADLIALGLAFMVLYAGVVALLTDK